MAYTANISRSNPACIVFLVDQSASMDDPIGDPSGREIPRRKCDVVADVLNSMLYELCLRSAKAHGAEDYFEIAVTGYGDHVASAFGGELAGRDLVPISEIGRAPLRVEEQMRSDGGDAMHPVKRPVWVESRAEGGTRMNLALQLARSFIDRFLRLHPDCYPPLIINMTDGEPTDGDPSALVEELQSCQSTDGATLVFNLHLGSMAAEPSLFPDDELRLPDRRARDLFRLSSVLPAPMRALAIGSGINVTDRSRGFAYNADLISVARFLDIGTRSMNLR